MIYPHLFDHYTVSYVTTSGSRVASATLTEANVPCFFQDAHSQNKQKELKQDAEQKLGVVFLTDGTIWEEIDIDHRIKFQGVSYVVKSKKDLCHLGRVFALIVEKDLTGAVTGV